MIYYCPMYFIFMGNCLSCKSSIYMFQFLLLVRGLVGHNFVGNMGKFIAIFLIMAYHIGNFGTRCFSNVSKYELSKRLCARKAVALTASQLMCQC